MQFLIISDAHANWHALEAVWADSGMQFDHVICCGDIVGYNAQPARVLEWTLGHCSSIIRGNHDKVVAGLENLEWFNDVAQVAARWTKNNLHDRHLASLRDLPLGPLKLEHFHIWHGSPRDEDEYVTSPREAASCFPHFELPLAFFGHTHLQGGFVLKGGRVSPIPAVKNRDSDSTWQLDPDAVYMVNPGSVGQPRDRDPRAAYATYDSDRRVVSLHRVEYSIEKVAAEIMAEGLPDVLALRLFEGM